MGGGREKGNEDEEHTVGETLHATSSTLYMSIL